jgi:hypothetical protein
MKHLTVYLKQPAICRAWALALAASLAFFACSNGDDVAGGVTDIGNSIAREPDTTKIAGTVVDMQGNRMPAARLSLYWDNGYAIEDSLEAVADSNAQFEFRVASNDLHGYLQNGRTTVIQYADSAKGVVNVFAGVYLYARSGSLSGISLPPNGKATEVRIGSRKALRGSMSGVASGKVHIGGTHLSADIQEDGSFSFDSIPPGMMEELIYSENDSVLGYIPFTIQDEGDSVVLPQLENYDGFLWNPDLPMLADAYGFSSYHTDYVVRFDTSRSAVDINMTGDEQVFNHNGKLADSVNYVDGVKGKAVLLEPGQYIDLDTLNPTGGDFTLSLWTKWNGPNGEHQVLFCQRAYWSDSTSRFQWHYEVNSGSFAVMKSMPGRPEAVFFGDSTSVPVGEWAMLTLVSRDHKVSMYVNGKPVAIAGSDGTEFVGEFVPNELTRSVPFRIGGDEIETETWNGAIDEIRIESIAHSPEWIKIRYDNLKP